MRAESMESPRIGDLTKILLLMLNLMLMLMLTISGPGGVSYMPPLPRICVYLCKLDFSQLYVWKRAVCFLPLKIISFCKTK